MFLSISKYVDVRANGALGILISQRIEIPLWEQKLFIRTLRVFKKKKFLCCSCFDFSFPRLGSLGPFATI